MEFTAEHRTLVVNSYLRTVGFIGGVEKITFLQSTSSQELTIATLSTACSSDNGSLMRSRRDLIPWFFNLLRAVLDEPGKCEALLSSRMFENGAIWAAQMNSSSCLCVETRRHPDIMSERERASSQTSCDVYYTSVVQLRSEMYIVLEKNSIRNCCATRYDDAVDEEEEDKK
ncbi:hypothetical protein C0J52_27139 [Blattella germanica]|nr:hypothetical protein C0J52_27139 [Blattella germanica]